MLWKVTYNHRGQDKTLIVSAPNVSCAEDTAVSELRYRKEAFNSVIVRIEPIERRVCIGGSLKGGCCKDECD
jgi:hypothetical protein